MKSVVFFQNLGFLIESISHFGIINFEKWKKQLWKCLSDFNCRKVIKGKFLCLNVQSLKLLNTKISRLLRFSEIGIKLGMRKNFLYLSLGVCSKISKHPCLDVSNTCLDLFFSGYQGTCQPNEATQLLLHYY